jgi:hypothetical protein
MRTLPQQQRDDDNEIEHVRSDRVEKRRSVISEQVIQRAAHPCPGGHAGATEQQQRRDSPPRASLTGKNSRRVSTYAGTSPLNPNPKNADAVNRPISSCVIRNAVSAEAWVAEHTESVISPPVWSEPTVAGKDREPPADHDCTEHDGPTHADSIGDPAHGEAAEADAEPGERPGERRRRGSAAIVFNATTAIQGAPNEHAMASSETLNSPGFPGFDRRSGHPLRTGTRALMSQAWGRGLWTGGPAEKMRSWPEAEAMATPDGGRFPGSTCRRWQ